MGLFTVALVAGALLGLATGGSLSALGRLSCRAWPALVAAVVMEGCLGLVHGWPRPLLAVAACLAVASWCLANQRASRGFRLGYGLLGLGVLANTVVIALNSGMPVSRSALAAAGLGATFDPARGDFYKHTAMTSHTALAWLGDRLPFHLAYAHTVLSAGDLLMLMGLAVVAWAAVKAPVGGSVRLAKLASRTVAGAATGSGD